jgi:hypothetical protein
MINQSELKALLEYNKDTGEFYWIDGPFKGMLAGTKCKSTGYIRIKINQERYGAHRLAWLYVTGEWPIKFIDHKNLKRDDNKWLNLRQATVQQNQLNKDGCKSATSKLKGVSWDKRRKQWRAQATFNRKTYNLGRFDNEKDASDKYQEFCMKMHGEFFRKTVG